MNLNIVDYIRDSNSKVVIERTQNTSGEASYDQTAYVYDGLGRAIKVTDAYNGQYVISYNDVERSKSVQFLPNGNTTAAETIIDVISLGISITEFVNSPSFAGFGYMLWDGIGIVFPFGPDSYVTKLPKGASKVTQEVVEVAKSLNKTDSCFTLGVNNAVKGGKFKDIDNIKKTNEVGHHMPQNAYNSTIGVSRSDGPAILISNLYK